MLWGAVLLVYRIPIARCRNFRRSSIIWVVQFAIGWIVSVIFARLFTQHFWIATIVGVLGGFVALLSEWMSVHAVASFIGALVPALLLGIPYRCTECPAVLRQSTVGEVFLPNWWSVVLLMCSAFFVSTLFLLFPSITKTWEVVGVPMCGSYACIVPWMHPGGLLLHPFYVSAGIPEDATTPATGDNWPWLVWCGLTLFAILIQWWCAKSRRVDIDDPYGAQNDIVKALLADENVSESQLFMSRFPEITRAMNDQGVVDPVTFAKQGLGAHRGEALTEQQLKLIQACKDDPEQRDRILFGGGLY